MKPVYSSMVSEVGYDEDTGELLVKWAKSGKVSAYAGVPEDTATDLADGRVASVGLYINSDIKDRYQHRYR
jgi:hypothetical protein